MITWLLEELEKNPTSLFRKKDLLKRSKKQFEVLEQQGFLNYMQPSSSYDTYPCTFPCSDSCPMDIVEMDGKHFAICPKDTEKDPIELTNEDISKYSFSFETLADEIRKANGFTGYSYSIPPRLYFIGDYIVDDVNTAFIMAFFSSIKFAETQLLSLLALIPTNYGQIIVITPSLRLTNGDIYPKLRTASIYPVTLQDSFGQHDYKISYLAALKKRIPAGVNTPEIKITDKQLAECERYGYECREDYLYIPGTPPKNRTNDIFLNGRRIELADSLFTLLLRFIVELKKGKGGWIESSRLASDGYVNDSEDYRPYSNLRTALKGRLKQGDSKKFIESSRSKRFRISMHPDFIKCESNKLLKHPDSDIRELAKKLPVEKK